ncbi:MAG: hypothetical protein IPJ82_13310 [Lewinellaceae bacterium]|nr:hypothetical protein [Lewinellaceae bacterium]
MLFPRRVFALSALLASFAGGIYAQVSLQGMVSYLNSGSRPAVGVDISAFGANTVQTTDMGMFG